MLSHFYDWALVIKDPPRQDIPHRNSQVFLTVHQEGDGKSLYAPVSQGIGLYKGGVISLSLPALSIPEWT